MPSYEPAPCVNNDHDIITTDQQRSLIINIDHLWSMSTDHISLYWSHWSISITTNPYWSSLIGINQSSLIYSDHHWSNVDHYWSLTWDVSSCPVPMAAMLVSSQLLSAYTLSLEPLTPQVYWSWSCSIIVYRVGTTIHSLERTIYIQCIHCENKTLFWTC